MITISLILILVIAVAGCTSVNVPNVVDNQEVLTANQTYSACDLEFKLISCDYEPTTKLADVEIQLISGSIGGFNLSPMG